MEAPEGVLIMNADSSIIETRITPGTTIKPRFLDGIAKRALLKRLHDLSDGKLILIDGDLHHEFGEVTNRCSLTATIRVKHPRFYSDIAFGGSIGAGEAYMADYWETTDLTSVVRILLANRNVLDGMEGGLASITAPIQKTLHWLNRNTQTGSRRNIAAHYDLGNDLFKLMLDETMMYSSAIFPKSDTSLYDAQIYRLNSICQKLDLQPSDHLLEIGTGWGGLSIHAAKYYGCRVTTITISQEQYDLAFDRVRKEGLNNKITVLLQDYRGLKGQYDKVVSVEMIEAVGHQFYDAYFSKCSQLLKPDGMMLLQAITIADQQYESAKKSVDFIQRYIFPGSCIPSITAMVTSITQSSDMRLLDLSDIGPHYAVTLHKWRENVADNTTRLKGLGYNDEFLRMWEFYLCYCEGGFIERAISDVHMLLAKPDNRRHCIA